MNYFKFSITDSNSDVRRKLINSLTLGLAAIAVIALIITILFDSTAGATKTWNDDEMFALYTGILLMVIIMPVLFLLNQRFSTLAGWLLLLFVWSTAILGDTPDHIAERGLIIFTLPIVAASAILPSWTSFIVAGLSSLTISVIQTLLLGEPVPNFVAIIVLFTVAFISYLSNISKERVLHFMQKVNAQLDIKLKTQQQDLIRVVNDFTFLANNQQNVVILFGPHRGVLFANKEATSLIENMDDDARLQYQSVVERAWEKNLYVHTRFSDVELKITSSLIDTERGTCLLLQAVRLPDEESKRSLEDWQQKLIAANNLPDGTEFDVRVGKMRVKTRDNGKVSKKVVFELKAGTLGIKHPSSQEIVWFDLEDLIALCRSE